MMILRKVHLLIPSQYTQGIQTLFRGTLLLGLILMATSNVIGAPGETSASFLKVDVGAKAVAMGGSQFGSENDSFAQFYNPALLSGINQKEIGFMHNEFFSDIRQEVFAYVHPSKRHGNFAGAINYFTFGEILGFDAQGVPTSKIGASDIMVSGSWSKPFSFTVKGKSIENLSTGATLKIINKKLDNESAMSFALDLGFSYPFKSKYVKGLKVAGYINNIGPGIKFDNVSNSLPRTTRLGLAYSFWGDMLTTTVDEVFPSDNTPYPIFGIQYKIRQMISARIGYKGNDDLDKKFTFGVGFENPVFNMDYAFIPFGDLGDTHRISVGFRFGGNTRKKAVDDQLSQKVREAKAIYARGYLVDAYLAVVQVRNVAPWMDENNKLLKKIQKDFRDLEDTVKKDKLRTEIDGLFTKAEKFFEDGNLIMAKLMFKAVVELQPDHKVALGYIHQIEGQFRSFIENFYRAGMVAFAEGNYKIAKDEYEKVLVIQPDHKEAKSMLSKTNKLLTDQLKEEEKVVKAELVEKTYNDALKAFGSAKYALALDLLRDVLRLDPNHQEAQKYEALASETLFKRSYDKASDHVSKGEWANALKELKIALRLNPSSKEATRLMEDASRRWDLQKKVLSQKLYKEGLEAFLNGDKNKAKDLWTKALKLDSSNEEAKRGLSRLQ